MSIYVTKGTSVEISYDKKNTRQCKDAEGKANKMLEFIHLNIFFKDKDIIEPLYVSVTKPHLE